MIRDLQQRHVQQLHPGDGPWQQVVEFFQVYPVPWPGQAHEAAKADEPLRLVPDQEFCQRIGAHDEVEFRFRAVLVAQ